MTTSVPFTGGIPGAAASDTSDVYVQKNLLLGSVPPHGGPKSYKYKAGSSFAIYSVVGVGTDGYLALATTGGSSNIAPLGILTDTISNAPADGTLDILTSGHYNIDALVWDASFSTDALKQAAFGVPSTILLGLNKYGRLS